MTCPPPGDLPDPGIEPGYPALQGDSLPTEPPGKPPGYLGYLDIGYFVQVPKSELYMSGSLRVVFFFKPNSGRTSVKSWGQAVLIIGDVLGKTNYTVKS